MNANGDEGRRVLRVRSGTGVKALAGAVAGEVRAHGCATMQAVGAGAVNQAIKAVAAAQTMDLGVLLAAVPSFVELNLAGEERSGLRIEVVALRAGSRSGAELA